MRYTICALLVFWIIKIVLSADIHDTGRTIVRVNSNSVLYSDIMMTTEDVARAFKYRFHRDPSEEDQEQVQALQQELEASRLVTLIRRQMRNAELQRLQIMPSEAEINARCEQDYPLERRREMGQKARQGAMLLIQAYEGILVDKQSPDQVFESLLDGLMTREEWDLRLEHDVNTRSLQNLRRSIDRPVEELFDCHVMMQQLIIMEREGPVLDAEIAKSDPEYREYLRLADENPSSPEVQDKGPMYRRARRDEWWQKRFAEAQIEIIDPRYQGALDALISGSP